MLRSVPGHDWQVDTASREILRGNQRFRLAEKPFRVLVALVDARGGVVTRAALQRLLWTDDTFVDFENNLNSAVAALRSVLAERVSVSSACIETIPKVGYRLVPLPSVETVRHAAAEMLPPDAAGRPRLIPFAFMIAAALVGGLVATIVMGEWPEAPVRSAMSSTSSRGARTLFERGVYLRGRFLTSTSGQPSDLVAAREAFVRAARLDPRFVAAAAEEADTLVEMSFAGVIGVRDGLQQARDAARRALALDAAQPDAARVAGLAALFLDWDFVAARNWIERAADADVDARTALARAIWLASAGRYDAAVAAAERAVALDPAAYYVRADLAMFYLAANREAEAAESCRHVLEAAPDFLPARAYALMAEERLGQWARAARHARALMRARGGSEQELALVASAGPRDAVALWRRWEVARLERLAEERQSDFALELALHYGALGERDLALRGLHDALARRSPLLVLLRSYPELSGLRGDPEFEAIARAVNPVSTDSASDLSE